MSGGEYAGEKKIEGERAETSSPNFTFSPIFVLFVTVNTFCLKLCIFKLRIQEIVD